MKLLRIQAVVSDEDGPAKRRLRQGANPRQHGQVDFKGMSDREIVRQVLHLFCELLARTFTRNEAQVLGAVSLDEQFLPDFAIPAHEMHRKGVRQLVAEKKSLPWAGFQRIKAFHPLHPVTQTLELGLPVTRIRFHNEVAQG